MPWELKDGVPVSILGTGKHFQAFKKKPGLQVGVSQMTWVGIGRECSRQENMMVKALRGRKNGRFGGNDKVCSLILVSHWREV